MRNMINKFKTKLMKGKDENIRSEKEKNKRKKVIGTGIAAAVLVTTVAALSIVNLISPVQEKLSSLDPTMERAMTYPQVKAGDEAVAGTSYITFDAFFTKDLNGDGYAEKIRGSSNLITASDTLYITLNVLNQGTLQNGVITINGQNIYLQTAIVADSIVTNNVITPQAGSATVAIPLNTVNAGTQKLISALIKPNLKNNINNYSSAVNTVTLAGNYVSADGQTVTPVSKTVQFTVDWNGSVVAKLNAYATAGGVASPYGNPNTITYNINSVKTTDTSATFNFGIAVHETAKQLLLKENYTEMTLPALNGYLPTSVTVSNTNLTSSYDAATGIFTIKQDAVTDSNGNITASVPVDGYYSIAVTYPIEAYTIQNGQNVLMDIPVSTYYLGYNNPNTEFSNPIKSNVAKQDIYVNYINMASGNIPISFSIYTGKYVYQLNPYFNAYVVSKQNPYIVYGGGVPSKADLYNVQWSASVGIDGADSITMQENPNTPSDQFINADSSVSDMSPYMDNVGIYFSNPANMLGADGYIDVYDSDTGVLLHRFTSADWAKYTAASPYMYNQAVGHIKVVTSRANANTTLNVYNVKEINDAAITNAYTEEDFGNINYINSALAGSAVINGTGTNTSNISARAVYLAPQSVAIISSVAPNYVTTQSMAQPVSIQIQTLADNITQAQWKDGTFVLELPPEILEANISSVTVNNSGVAIDGYEVYKEGGQLFIKVQTSNSEEAVYTITVNADLTVDPRSPTTTNNIKLYADNPNNEIYLSTARAADKYDINGNENAAEYVAYSQYLINIYAPSGLTTSQTISNYNDAGDISVSPQIAEIDKSDASRTANINVEIKNNYSNTITNIKIVGKIPFAGNDSQLVVQDLGSTFTTVLTGPIVLPPELAGIAKVYYSTNETVTEDLTDPANGWTATPADWSKVKTYLIDLGSYTLSQNQNEVFTYTVSVPAGVAYNQVSYSTHAVYFDLNTSGGLLSDKTEVFRAGIRIARKYNIEITKYKEGTSFFAAGAAYSATAEGETSSIIAITNSNGLAVLKNLYIDTTYTLKEISAPADYELNPNPVQFKVTENSDGTLKLVPVSGNFENAPVIGTNNGADVLKLNTSDKPKYTLTLNKKDGSTGTQLQGVTFNVEGRGIPSGGRKYMTNAAGQIVLKGLSLDQTYTLTEVSAKGYYLSGPIQFKLTRGTGGALQFAVLSGAFDNAAQTLEAAGTAQPQVTVNLSNELIPQYTLNLTKVDKDNPAAALAGAQFEISGPGITGTRVYTAGSGGKVQITGLYAYVQGKNIDGIYTIKEVYPPEGYALNNTPVQFRLVQDAGGNLSMEYISGAFDQDAANAQIDQINKTASVTMSDRPLFKITKTDGDTGVKMANVKFAIYAVDSSGNASPAYDPSGNLVGSEEVVNGVTYNQVLTTNANGEITAPLKTGMYKAVEIASLNGYSLPANEADRTYYFGIGAGQPGQTNWQQVWRGDIGGSIYCQSVTQTADGGYVAVGYFPGGITISGTKTADGKAITLTSNGAQDGILIKYDSSGKVEYAYSIGGTSNDDLYAVTVTTDGGYVAVGSFSGGITIPWTQTVDGADITLTSNGGQDGIIIKYDSNGKVEYAYSIGGAGGDYLYGVTVAADGGYVAVGLIGYSITISGTKTADGKAITLTNNGSYDGIIIKYNSSGKVEYAQNTGGGSYDCLYGVTVAADGGYVAVGYITGNVTIPGIKTADGTDITLTGIFNYDGIIIKYDSNGKVEWAQNYGGTSSDYLYGVTQTADGGFATVGYFPSSSITIPGTQTADGADITLTSNGSHDGIIIKYDSSGKVEYAQNIGGTNSDYLYEVTSTADGGFAAVGYMSQTTIIPGKYTADGKDITLTGGETVIKYDSNGKIEFAPYILSGTLYGVTSTTDGGFAVVGNGGDITKFQPVVLQPKVPELSALDITNYKLEHKITTAVNGTGGSISGQDQKPYETVTDGESSTKDIIITPDAGYKVSGITINGEPAAYTAEPDGTVNLSKFINMTEDKNVVASFAAGIGEVIVHHYLYANGMPTTTELAPDQTLSRQI